MSEYKTLNTIAYEHIRRMIYDGELVDGITTGGSNCQDWHYSPSPLYWY